MPSEKTSLHGLWRPGPEAHESAPSVVYAASRQRRRRLIRFTNCISATRYLGYQRRRYTITGIPVGLYTWGILGGHQRPVRYTK